MWDFPKVYVKKSFVGVWGLLYLCVALCMSYACFSPRTGVTSLSDSINGSHFNVVFFQQILKNLLEFKPSNARLPNYTSWAVLTSYTENSLHVSKTTPQNKHQLQIKSAKLLQITGNAGFATLLNDWTYIAFSFISPLFRYLFVVYDCIRANRNKTLCITFEKNHTYSLRYQELSI